MVVEVIGIMLNEKSSADWPYKCFCGPESKTRCVNKFRWQSNTQVIVSGKLRSENNKKVITGLVADKICCPMDLV